MKYLSCQEQNDDAPSPKQNTAPRWSGIFQVAILLALLADGQEPVAWVFCYFVASWQTSGFALAAFDLREEVDCLILAATKRDVFLVQEVLDPF